MRKAKCTRCNTVVWKSWLGKIGYHIVTKCDGICDGKSNLICPPLLGEKISITFSQGGYI
jgi:hypothetical protein